MSFAGHPVRIRRDDHELGSSVRAMRAPDPRLTSVMYRELCGFEQRTARFSSWLEPPRPAVTLIIDLAGAIRADGEPLPSAWLGGLDDRYTVVEFDGRYGSLDVELTLPGAYTVLGLPMSELDGGCVALEDLFGSDGARLADQVRDASEWSARFDVLERFLLARVTDGPRPAPAVLRAWQRLWATGGGVRIEALAAEIGCSRRHLQSAFRSQIGLAPKTVARQIRFQRVCRSIAQRPGSWARIAAEAGYCDQSHLNRDFRELAGTTPTEFVSRQIPGGGVVGDEVPFVQDAGRAARVACPA